MVRLSKQARRRSVSAKRPKVKTSIAKQFCKSCSCDPKAVQEHTKMHENAISGDIASKIFVAKY